MHSPKRHRLQGQTTGGHEIQTVTGADQRQGEVNKIHQLVEQTALNANLTQPLEIARRISLAVETTNDYLSQGQTISISKKVNLNLPPIVPRKGRELHLPNQRTEEDRRRETKYIKCDQK